MKIILIGHGKLPIPPTGWGAVEQVIADISKNLASLGHEVEIVNIPHRHVLAALLLKRVRQGKADVLWCHNERLVPHLAWMYKLFSRHLVETCHSPVPNTSAQELGKLLPVRRAAKSPVHLSLHPSLSEAFKLLNPAAKIVPLKNGVDVSSITMSPQGNGRALCLGRISERKRQRIVAEQFADEGVPIDFVGPQSDTVPSNAKVSHLASYLGEWSREEVCNKLSNYSALVLWSDGEVQPLVVIEALAAGLDVVVSREAARNLDPTLSFVHVVDSIESLAETTKIAILGNKTRRSDIREYAKTNWDWPVVLESVVQQIERGFEPVKYSSNSDVIQAKACVPIPPSHSPLNTPQSPRSEP